MSFISTTNGRGTGYFLESEVGAVRKTREIAQSGATTVGNEKYVFAGTVWPSNDGNAEGIVFEDVCVTSGNMPGSVVVAGRVYKDRITISDAAVTALEAKGFTFIPAVPAITRPY